MDVARYVAVMLTIWAACGCGPSEPTRYDLSGKVTYKNMPVPAGQIIFTPDGDKGNAGPGTSAEIKDGQFQTPKDRGTIGGPHVIMVHGFDGKAIPIPGDPNKNVNPNGTPIFPPARMERDLPKQAGTQNFEVK